MATPELPTFNTLEVRFEDTIVFCDVDVTTPTKKYEAIVPLENGNVSWNPCDTEN